MLTFVQIHLPRPEDSFIRIIWASELGSDSANSSLGCWKKWIYSSEQNDAYPLQLVSIGDTGSHGIQRLAIILSEVVPGLSPRTEPSPFSVPLKEQGHPKTNGKIELFISLAVAGRKLCIFSCEYSHRKLVLCQYLVIAYASHMKHMGLSLWG
ncbi:hypothetical protein Y1Q_0014332 [Alligator mississippiensis]|uniref:Uncharacterized protein n=1 Tax=Alligator mississippiensis TaxID=8496 RepID=A0A151N1W7_ALLMI|nr:hypothetical protein Y1Q_0014332 [Alligator mississippiensis]